MLKINIVGIRIWHKLGLGLIFYCLLQSSQIVSRKIGL